MNPTTKNPLSLLFLTHQGDIAGSTYSISYLAKGLAERGHAVFVGCREESLLFELLHDTPVQRIAMPFRGKFDRKMMQQIHQIVQQHRIQLINPQSGQDRYLTAFSQMWYRFNAIVVHTRRQRPKSDGGWLQAKFYTAVTDKIVAVSYPIQQHLVQLGIPASHIHVIHNGTPIEKYQHLIPAQVEALRTKYALSPTDIVVGCVGRHKQQEQLLQALHSIEQPLTLLLVGIEETPELNAITQGYATPHRIIYTGMIPPQDVLHHYPLFQLKVLPSNMEGLSQSLLEAMAMGVPVIATDAAGNPDLVQHEQNGLLFPEGDTATLAQWIQRLLREPALRNRLVEAGQHTALHTFSIENTVRNYEAFFQQLIEAKRP